MTELQQHSSNAGGAVGFAKTTKLWGSNMFGLGERGRTILREFKVRRKERKGSDVWVCMYIVLDRWMVEGDRDREGCGEEKCLLHSLASLSVASR